MIELSVSILKLIETLGLRVMHQKKKKEETTAKSCLLLFVLFENGHR
jgi:hypothetical protein